MAVGRMLTKTAKTQGEKTVGGTQSTNKSKFCFGCDKFEMPISHPTGSIKLFGNCIIDTVQNHQHINGTLNPRGLDNMI